MKYLIAIIFLLFAGTSHAQVQSLTGDCSVSNTLVITCPRSGGLTIGSMAYQSANAVAITGGTETGVVYSSLTASLPICTDASKVPTSTCPAGDLPILIGTTSAIGGSPLLAGACAAGTVTVSGATSAMVANTSPAADPDSVLSTGIAIYAFVSSANTVTVRVCAIVAVTPTAVAYNVRVIQ